MKKKYAQTVSLLFCIAAAITAVSCGGKKENIYNKIQREKKVVVGTSADYPPYEFHIQKDGKDEITGFDIAIARSIADSLGAELVIRDMDFDGLLPALVSGSVDMVLAGMTPNDERRQNVDFSDIYYTAEHGVIIRKADAEKYAASADSLKDGMIGAQRGAVQAGIAKKEIKAVPAAELDKPHNQIKELGRLPDLILEVKSGKIDAVIVELPVAERYINEHPDLMLAAYTFKDADGGSAVAVKKGETEFVNAINKAVSELKAQNKIHEFAAKAIQTAEQQ